MGNTRVRTDLKNTIMSLFFNTLNMMLPWNSSDGSEQQTDRNGSHKSEKVLKLISTSIKVITEGETKWSKKKKERREEKKGPELRKEP